MCRGVVGSLLEHGQSTGRIWGKLTLLSPAAFSCQKLLSGTSQAPLHPFHDEIFPGFILSGSCACSHSCCKCTGSLSLLGRFLSCFLAILYNTRLLESFKMTLSLGHRECDTDAPLMAQLFCAFFSTRWPVGSLGINHCLLQNKASLV